jgi:hypothetical protein
VVGKLKLFDGNFEVDVFQRESSSSSLELQELRHFPAQAEEFALTGYKFHHIKVGGVGIQTSEHVSDPRLTWSSQDQVLCDSLARFCHAKA